MFEHTSDSRSFLLYCETCVVDHDGLLQSIRMNAADFSEARRMADAGLIEFGRIPARLLNGGEMRRTHWVRLTESGWQEAHQLRRERASRNPHTPYSKAVFEAIAEREEA